MRSRRHRWIERILAFGGLAYWLLAVYGALAFAAALLTSLTTASVIRIFAELGVVLAAFGALIAHRWVPRATRAAHWAMVTMALITLGTCGELVELPPRYEAFDHRGIHVEFADEGVQQETAKIKDLIDQVYARSGLPEPSSPVRMRFLKNTGGGLVRVGDWSDAGAGGADVALSTSGGATRGSTFLLEGSFLLTEVLARRVAPGLRNGARDGFSYWTMLGIMPRPDWAGRFLDGTLRPSCARVAVASVPLAVQEMTIWLGDSQTVLRLDASPFIDAERDGGATAARALFSSASGLDSAPWLAIVSQHCSSAAP